MTLLPIEQLVLGAIAGIISSNDEVKNVMDECGDDGIVESITFGFADSPRRFKLTIERL